MKLAFLFVGGQKESWAVELAQAYQKKLKPFVATEVIRLKASQQARESRAQKMKDESDAILKNVTRDDFVILCDETGDQPTSLKLSQKVVKIFEFGKPRVVVIVAGAYGASPELKERANWKWSFSNQTFNHYFAQVFAMEQIFRAFTIWKNLPYHNE
jgi:23S rRNA (pseudouridine1915-N3)-methyltransferase